MVTLGDGSQSVVTQQLLELGLVVGVELLGEVVGHVGHDPGPHVGALAQGSGLSHVLLGLVSELGKVDLNLRDGHHGVKESPASVTNSWGHQ